MQVHYLNHEHFKEGDTKLAARYAAKLMKEDKSLKTLTFLVLSQHQYEPFLGEMGFSAREIKAHGVPSRMVKYRFIPLRLMILIICLQVVSPVRYL